MNKPKRKLYNISEQINKTKKEYSNNENEIKRTVLTLEEEKMNFNNMMNNLKITFAQLNVNYTLSQINPTLMSFTFYKYNYKGKEYKIRCACWRGSLSRIFNSWTA